MFSAYLVKFFKSWKFSVWLCVLGKLKRMPGERLVEPTQELYRAALTL